MNIRFTQDTVDDLIRLREFIGVKNPLAANRIANELKTGINKLVTFPELGLKVEQALEPEKIRDLFIGEYTIRYLISKAEIVILRLWHDKENARNG
ncbi:type II toxin-antitoxin system RelE/ParE family toxin [Paraneptunicella aestuarii]|uniref:type II toxin-antitoxin system RelE/ParE family toxin n=1 Tax=Paraneptunicella aestuarii TaxID=2831148 RepID=UPI001E4E6219|nr:type II toxin-antitoxin system RelE/ParE family toxin [Paraneptunicella aestuarii]UAA39909.1 type II toxin-antitoxin system RelE/ParE family toxin [Paraneptunicella aestuarii]